MDNKEGILNQVSSPTEAARQLEEVWPHPRGARELRAWFQLTEENRGYDWLTELLAGLSYAAFGALELAIRLKSFPLGLGKELPLEILIPYWQLGKVGVRLASRGWREVAKLPTGTLWERNGITLAAHHSLLPRPWKVAVFTNLIPGETDTAELPIPLPPPQHSWVAARLLLASGLFLARLTRPTYLLRLIVLKPDKEQEKQWEKLAAIWRFSKLWEITGLLASDPTHTVPKLIEDNEPNIWEERVAKLVDSPLTSLLLKLKKTLGRTTRTGEFSVFPPEPR